MPLPFVTTYALPSGADVILFARIVGAAATPITQATVSSVTVQLTDLTKEAQLAGSGAIATLTPTVAACVYNALQQSDPAWQKDGAYAAGGSVANPVLGPDGLYGYNFRTVVPGVDTPGGTGDRLQATVRFTMADGSIIKAIFVWPSAQTFV